MPLISVITVTFNASKYIEPTLKSLEAQTFKDFEHIVIDGASKDNTLDIVKKFPELNSIIISEPDKGLYDAMNKGMRNATGRFLLFLNAGDAFHASDTLEKYARKAKEDFDIIYGDTNIVDSKRNFISPRHLSVPHRLTFKSFSKGMLVCHQAFMVKKEFAPEYDLNYRFSADYDWCIKCIKKTDAERCNNLGEVTIDYLNDGLTGDNKMKSLKERFHIMGNHYGYLPTTLNHIGFLFRALLRKIRR